VSGRIEFSWLVSSLCTLWPLRWNLCRPAPFKRIVVAKSLTCSGRASSPRPSWLRARLEGKPAHLSGGCASQSNDRCGEVRLVWEVDFLMQVGRWLSWWPWRRSSTRASSIDFADHDSFERCGTTEIPTQRPQSTQRRYKAHENSIRPLTESQMFGSLLFARCVLRGEMLF